VAAPKQLDVYRDWLGITEAQRPLNYYQLLRLKMFADDTAQVRDRYQKMNAHVCKFSTGEHAQQAQQLLQELAKAMLCLTDAQGKREYDASLGRTESRSGQRRTAEEILLANKAISEAQLAKARSFAAAVGLETRDALVQQKAVAPDAMMLAYAESVGLPYLELADVPVDETLIAQVPPLLARQHSCIPVMVDRGQLLVASTSPLVPDVEEELRLRFGMPVRTALCTAAGINAMLAKYFPHDAGGPVVVPAQKGGQAAVAPQPVKILAPLSPDELSKRCTTTAIVAFNVSVVACILLFVLRRGGFAFLSTTDFVITLLVSSAFAAAGFVLTAKLRR
jgi:hypothetical protein